jgi:hypothetical protein
MAGMWSALDGPALGGPYDLPAPSPGRIGGANRRDPAIWDAGRRRRRALGRETARVRALRPLTRWLPSLILWASAPFSEGPSPLRPEQLSRDASREELAAEFSDAARAADGRARAAVPAAGLLGTIAGVFRGNLEHRTLLIVIAAATILAALFAESARVEQNPGSAVSRSSLETAAYALRRKEAWGRLAGYLSFALAAALVYLTATS